MHNTHILLLFEAKWNQTVHLISLSVWMCVNACVSSYVGHAWPESHNVLYNHAVPRVSQDHYITGRLHEWWTCSHAGMQHCIIIAMIVLLLLKLVSATWWYITIGVYSHVCLWSSMGWCHNNACARAKVTDWLSELIPRPPFFFQTINSST